MLVLTRRAGESIHIGENIVIKVLRIKGNQAHLGIEAPKGVPVAREEVEEKYAALMKGHEEGQSGAS